MPWYPGVSVRITDAHLWAIVCADPTVSNRQLAAQLDAAVGTVTDARRRQRRITAINQDPARRASPAARR